MSEQATLGQIVKEHREALKMSVDELAHKVGVTSRYIYKIEAGESKPRIDVVFRIINALGIPASEVFGGIASHEKDIIKQ